MWWYAARWRVFCGRVHGHVGTECAWTHVSSFLDSDVMCGMAFDKLSGWATSFLGSFGLVHAERV